MNKPTTPSELITAILCLMPDAAMIAAATDDELKQFRSVSNILANLAYIEVMKREAARNQKP